MTTTLSTLLALHHASQACQQAHDALVAVGLTAAAAHVHKAGELVALAVGMFEILVECESALAKVARCSTTKAARDRIAGLLAKAYAAKGQR